jgi:hypothetical protein
MTRELQDVIGLGLPSPRIYPVAERRRGDARARRHALHVDQYAVERANRSPGIQNRSDFSTFVG